MRHASGGDSGDGNDAAGIDVLVVGGSVQDGKLSTLSLAHTESTPSQEPLRLLLLLLLLLPVVLALDREALAVERVTRQIATAGSSP